MEKLTQEEFEKRLKSINCVSQDKYINNTTKITVTHLSCGSTFKIRPMELFLLKDGKCPMCQKYRHYSYDDIVKLFESSYPEYTILSKNGTKIKVKHNCGAEFDTTLKLFRKAKVPCPICSHRNIKRTDAEFKDIVRNVVGDEYTFLEPYKNNMTKLRVRHNKCGHEYDVTPNKFLQLGRRCPYCAHCKKKTLNEVKTEFAAIDPAYEILSTEYVNNETPLKVLHKTCGKTFMVRKQDFIKPYGNRCPHCRNRRSVHEELIEDYLNKNNIAHIHPYKISNNRSFDFYIKEKNIMLEYDGEYHYMPIAGNSEKFHNQQKSDKIKEQYCMDNNILLIRIPYWYQNNIESILNKIISGCIPSSNIIIQEHINTDIPYFDII